MDKRWRFYEDSVNKCLETAGETLNITCNFLYSNHQVHKDFLIALYVIVYPQRLSYGILRYSRKNIMFSERISPSHRPKL
jgi:hypothetical protein